MGMTAENMSISEFLRRPYLQQDVNTALIAKNNYTNPVQMWNHKTRAFLNVKRPKVILKQEELFDLPSLQRKLLPLRVCLDPVVCAAQGCWRLHPSLPRSLQEHGFVLANSTISFPMLYEEKSIRGEEINSPLEYKFSKKGLDAARAKATVPANAFSPDDLAFIKSQLDPGVVEAAGYAPILRE